MINIDKIASYYSQAHPFHHKFLKEIFSECAFENLKESTQRQSIIKSSEILLDDVFLFEARTFLRLAIFNLLAYKYLMCGNYLAWGKVTLYYSYFYSINSLLRLAGHAVVHATNLQDKIFTFHLVRETSSHNYRIMSMRESEHKFIWNTFSTLYPKLSTHKTGRLFIKDRVDWNYDLFYSSQITEEYALRHANIYCENNFLDPNFELSYTSEQAEYLGNLIADFGYEEMYAGDLIKESIRIFVAIAKISKFRSDYTGFIKALIEEIKLFQCKEDTKDEVESWLRSAIKEIS